MSIVSEIITGGLNIEMADSLCIIRDSFETHNVPDDMAANGLLTTMIGHTARTVSHNQLKDICSQVHKLEQQEVIELVAKLMYSSRLVQKEN